MKPSERIKQLAIDIRNTDMLGNRLATSHTPKAIDYIEAIIQFLDEQWGSMNCDPSDGQEWSWDKDLFEFEAVVANLRADGQTSRAEAVEYLIARCRHAEKRAVYWETKHEEVSNGKNPSH